VVCLLVDGREGLALVSDTEAEERASGATPKLVTAVASVAMV